MSSLSLVGCLLNSEQYFPRNQESDMLSLKTFFQLVHIHVNQKTKKREGAYAIQETNDNVLQHMIF